VSEPVPATSRADRFDRLEYPGDDFPYYDG
jgi:hypothetical protein